MHSSTLVTGLRVTALLLVLTSVTAWITTGAHRGWTQTSIIELHQDAITGIEYPVRRDTFVAGFEFLAAGLIGGLVLAGSTFIRPLSRSGSRLKPAQA